MDSHSTFTNSTSTGSMERHVNIQTHTHTYTRKHKHTHTHTQHADGDSSPVELVTTPFELSGYELNGSNVLRQYYDTKNTDKEQV